MTAVIVPTEKVHREPSRRVRVIRRLRRNPLALISFTVLVLAVLVAVLAPWLAPYSAEQTDFANAFSPPGTAGHLLGTDDLGRDVASRIILGSRASLEVALLAVATALVIGVPLGLAAGYVRAFHRHRADPGHHPAGAFGDPAPEVVGLRGRRGGGRGQ